MCFLYVIQTDFVFPCQAKKNEEAKQMRGCGEKLTLPRGK